MTAGRLDDACAFARVLPADDLRAVVNITTPTSKLTPLLTAILGDDPGFSEDLVSLLLACGPDVNRACAGLTPLGLCAQLDRDFAAGLLLQKGASRDKPSKHISVAGMPPPPMAGPLPPLHLAALFNATSTMRVLLADGVHPDVLDREGHSALWCATRANSLQAMQVLLAARADVRAGERGREPLPMAIRSGFHQEIQLLLRHSHGRYTSEWLGQFCVPALAAGEPSILQMLLEAGAESRVRHPTTGRNLWHLLAASQGADIAPTRRADPCLPILLQYYNDTSILDPDHTGRTCLELAAEHGWSYFLATVGNAFMQQHAAWSLLDTRTTGFLRPTLELSLLCGQRCSEAGELAALPPELWFHIFQFLKGADWLPKSRLREHAVRLHAHK